MRLLLPHLGEQDLDRRSKDQPRFLRQLVGDEFGQPLFYLQSVMTPQVGTQADRLDHVGPGKRLEEPFVRNSPKPRVP